MAREFISTGEAARLLGLSVERVRQLARDGTLRPFAETAGGRVFERREVLVLIEKRERQAAVAEGSR